MSKLTAPQAQILRRMIFHNPYGSHLTAEEEFHRGSLRVLKRLGYLERVSIPSSSVPGYETIHAYPTPAGVAALVREGYLQVDIIDSMTEKIAEAVARQKDSPSYAKIAWRHNHWRPICEAAGAKVHPPAEEITSD